MVEFYAHVLTHSATKERTQIMVLTRIELTTSALGVQVTYEAARATTYSINRVLDHFVEGCTFIETNTPLSKKGTKFALFC